MAEPAPEISVVVPLLDESATLRELVDRLAATLPGTAGAFEVLLVDDGSTDGTRELLRELEAERPWLRVFEFTRNFGQVAAIACGIFAARGEIVVTLDGDLQNPPEEIPKLVAVVRAGAEIATARRGQRYEGALRLLGSRVVHRVALGLTGVDLEDVGGSFKAYRREVVEAIRGAWAPGKPIFPLALWLGFPVSEVTVRHEPRKAGRSRYDLAQLARINVDLVTSLTTAPLAWLGIAGATLFGVGLLGALACVASGAGRIGLGAALSLTSVVVGAVFLAAGVLGAYLGRVYRQVAGEFPAFVVHRGPARDAGGTPRSVDRSGGRVLEETPARDVR